MPIDYSLYHPKWTLIRRLILKRANDCCELCEAPNHQLIYRTEKGKHNWELAPEGLQADAMALDGFTFTKIILTIAHMDHNRDNNDFTNLKALCQRCHLKHDIKHHTFNRKYGRETKRVNGKLF